MSESEVSILPSASGGYIVYIFDGVISHYKGSYATQEEAETRANQLRAS